MHLALRPRANVLRQPSSGRWAQWLCATAWCGSLACLGAAGQSGADAHIAEPSASRPSSAARGGYDLPSKPAGAAFPAQPLAPVASETRVARLSHTQYEHTVEDLLGLPGPLGATFPPDALNGFSFETSNAFRVDARLGPQYRGMAEALAARATADSVALARVVPCDTTLAGCRDRFLAAFGERAFRRPLSVEDSEVFRSLFDQGASNYASGDAFRDGVRLTIEAMLQAPEFLYRTESSHEVGPDGRIGLDDFEVASRLSYFLFDSMPDEELFAAAREGKLSTPDQVEAAARRMLGLPRVLAKLVAFHEQVWAFGRFAGISPELTRFSNVPKGFVWRVRQAALLFLSDVLRSGGGLEELLTAPYAYVDAALAPLYGVPVPPALSEAPLGRFARVEFEPGQREGLLMQLGYLASNAYSTSTDPIHRGLFVIRNLLCRNIPDPPPGATSTPPPETDQPIITTRDEVSLVTGQSFCPTCHSEINAPGFAFEGFDAIGQRRAADNGAAVDTASSMVLDGQWVEFDGATQLVERLARSKEAHRCYSRRWLEFAYGRPLAESDTPTLDAMAAESRPIADLIVAIVRSPAFLSLAPAGIAPLGHAPPAGTARADVAPSMLAPVRSR
jgi:uncharacterized protein DUF1592/uncharacterized protein DUF1588/uncharacterized protein DUF1595/uncharacterized protein DUF1585/uncharacterized protein DUF1587